MNFMGWIIGRLNDAGLWFYELYLDSYYTGWPLDVLANFFYFLSGTFYDLAWDFYYFSQWVNSVQSQIGNILSWSTIWSYILSYVPNLEDLRDWFYNWTSHVWGEVDDWWSSTRYTVQGWIDIAVSGFQVQISSVNSWLADIQSFIDELDLAFPDVSAVLAWFSNWTGELLSVVNTWWTGALLHVQGLINSAFLEREPFWAGWQDWRDKVIEFFTDPEDWLYNRLDSFFERFW